MIDYTLAECLLLLQRPGEFRWYQFALRGAQGRYNDHKAFVGIMDTMMKIEEREAAGKKMTNFKYDASYDEVCTTLALLSPRAYQTIRAEFGGRTLRSQR